MSPKLERSKVSTQQVSTTYPKISLKIWREDQNHPHIQGNKWWKLKYNLEEFALGNYERIISFGGAFSNHVYALSAACHALNIPLSCFIRGDGYDQNNPMLRQAKAWGCDLKFLDRTNYRLKEEAKEVNEYLKQYQRALIIPEGGSNALGFKGCVEWGKLMIEQSTPVDFLCIAAGTATSAAGLIEAYKDEKTKILVFSALKGNFMEAQLSTWTNEKSYEIISDYHFGGFAKINHSLVDFIRAFKMEHSIPLETIYTGKMVYGIMDLLDKGYFHQEAKIMAVHSGGLIGLKGFNYLQSSKFGKL